MRFVLVIDSILRIMVKNGGEITANIKCMYVWYGSKDENHVLSEKDLGDRRKSRFKDWYSLYV